jgi:hypothetical protein
MAVNGNGYLGFIAASAAATTAALAAAQTDFVSRKILNPERLDAKRRAEFQYRWKTAMEKTHLQVDYILAGGISKFTKNPEIVAKTTEALSSDEDLEELASRICKDKKSHFCTLKIDRDFQDSQGEFYLFIIDKKSPSTIRYQVPLMSFGLKLAKAFEDQLTSTTLCFAADASSGKGTFLLKELVQESKTGVAVLFEPIWMVQLARLVEANLFPSEKIQKLLFALCRMDAWCLREQSKDSRTVMIVLPGQATCMSLLPLVQRTFPEDRHVFVYDGCAASVRRGMMTRRHFGHGTRQDDLNKLIYTMGKDPIIHTIPLPSESPLGKSLYKLSDTLSQVPLEQAQMIETWMSSVDAFFKLKEDEDNNGYLPYVLKLKFLTSPLGDFKDQSESYWSICSLLQFITGTRSRALPEGTIDAAIEWLKDFNAAENKKQSTFLKLSDHDNTMIEECVFNHKLILIGDKTLKDTVQPKQHWTLKEASRKGGCACCGPDPFDEEEEDEERKATASKKTRMDMNTPGAFGGVAVSPASSRSQPQYVDGKVRFAFDPTRFS